MTSLSAPTPGQWLRRQRKAMDVTQEELASQIGCATVTLRKIEEGKLRPSKALASRIAEVLGIAEGDRDAFVRFARGSASHPQFALELRHAPSSLPAPITTLIGREAELAAIRQRILDGGTRLLTLVGPPGIGKTQLALEAAHSLRHEFDDGVFWVALDTLTSAATVAVAIAHALQLNIATTSPIEQQLTRYLRQKHLLLVLDNFEHVLDAAGLVSLMLTECPWLSVLATSRAPLRLRIERQLRVGPLTLPDPSGLPGPNTANLPAAVQLFAERAQSASPDFSLNADNLAAVCDLCRRLDGVPLAIELVATRATFASPGHLLSELDQHMLEFSSDWRDMPERHHTLGAAIEWSYRGLNAEQRDLYAGLAVFAGWFSLDAVTAIFGPASSDALCALVDQSLVVHRQGDAPATYRLLTPIREDAHRRLQARGDEARLRQHHAAYHLEWAEHTAARLRGPKLIGALDEIAGAIDNLHAALEWAIDEAADDALGLHLAIALWWYWHIRSYLGEGRHWLSRALERGKHAPPALRGRALTGLAVLTWYQGDLDLASQIIAEGVHALRAPDSNDSWRDLGIALSAASMIASFRSDPAGALAASAECATIAERLGDTWLQSLNSNAKGRATWLTRDLATARKAFEAGTALGRAMNDPWLTSLPLGNLGAVLIEMGDPSAARRCLEESLALCEQIGERWLRGMALQLLGQIAQQAGELRTSTAHYLEALRLSRELGLQIGVVAALNGLSRVAQMQGDYERSARLQAERQAEMREG